MGKLSSRFWTNSFVLNALKKAVVILTGLTFLILMTRYLGPEMRGRYAYILSFVSILSTIFNLGLSLVLPQFMRNKHRFGKDVFITMSLLQFLVYLIISLSVYTFSQNLELFWILSLSALTILSLQLDNLSLITNLKVHVFAKITSSVVNATLMAVLYFALPVRFEYIVLLYVVKESLVIMVTLSYLEFQVLRPSLEWAMILKQSFIPLLTSVLVALNYRVDILMLEGLKVDLYLIGIYSTGVALAEYSWLIPDVFKEVMLNKNTQKDSIALTNRSTRVSIASVVLCALGFMLLGKYIIETMFGNEFSSAFALSLGMFMVVPFIVLVKIIGTIFISNGFWKTYFTILAFSTGINVGLNGILIPIYGIYGSLVASVCSYAVCGLFTLFWYCNKFEIKPLDVVLIRKDDLRLISNFLRF